MKNVLITGAGGFIGSHLTERLVELGFNVTAFIRYNSRNNWGWLEKSKYLNEIKIITGDVRDYDSVRNAMKGVDAVFHLAALIGIPYSYVSPLAYIKTNVEGTYNILQAARDLGIERVIHTSTSEVYGTAQFVPISESHPINPQSPYAASKAAADFLALSYYRAFDLPVIVLRPFNTYGPRQSARAIIPTIITQILAGNREIKLGNINSTRDFNYVADIVDAFIQISKCDEAIGKVINAGSGKEISIEELVRTITSIIGVEVKIIQEEERKRPDKSEVMRLICDNSQIKKLINWAPKYDLISGLKITIEWIKKNIAVYKYELYNI
jgi:dTDP-glucose 4,6-dehydratase